MKMRLLAILVLVSLASALIGCGDKPPAPDDPNSKANAMKIKPGASGGATGGPAGGTGETGAPSGAPPGLPATGPSGAKMKRTE